MKTIGLIGSGHFGQAFIERFKESGFDAELLISRGRGFNAELVEAADLLIFCVRPQQLAALCQELREPLQRVPGQKTVVSFSAATPRAALESALGHPVIRAMADLQFDQMLSFPDEHIRPLFSAMSRNPLIEISDETVLEDYTILIACLSGVTAWQQLHHAAEAQTWLLAYAQFIQKKLGVPMTLLEKIYTKVDPAPAETLARMATPGGITEALTQHLDHNPTSTLEELYQAGKVRTETLKGSVAESLTVK
jgi:pyrroline-5-carboxylate reductase